MVTALVLLVIAAIVVFRGAGWLLVARRRLARGAARRFAWLAAVTG